ncbi:MAG: hypothetical protein IJ573_03160 [Clostridia bacterium]|nr:hypothetical protein [Clostridia bacterium]
MERQRTLGAYRAIDLSMFALILIVFESLIVHASNVWFSAEAWSVSSVAAVTAIVMIRWGPWGALHAMLGGIVFALCSHGTLRQFAIYGLGNLLCLTALPLIRRWGWERIRNVSWMNLLYSALVLLGMQAGRGLVSILLGTAPVIALGFITTDVLSYVFTMLIVWIASRMDGMLEDQKHYLARVNEPRDPEGGVR